MFPFLLYQYCRQPRSSHQLIAWCGQKRVGPAWLSTTKNKKTVCASDSNPSANGVTIVPASLPARNLRNSNQHLIARASASLSQVIIRLRAQRFFQTLLTG
ncbi:MAG: hypothetical protein DMF70_16885 [Acidobacteria bacterium]|nr:MAG: hypothetical protein DMF70_16885 [Acidobacteriota bacterium]